MPERSRTVSVVKESRTVRVEADMPATSPIAVWPKDPSALLDYTIDWTEWLGLDAINTSSFTVPSGLLSPTTAGPSRTSATIWLSSGVAGTSYLVPCAIVTFGGRTEVRTIQIDVGLR